MNLKTHAHAIMNADTEEETPEWREVMSEWTICKPWEMDKDKFYYDISVDELNGFIREILKREFVKGYKKNQNEPRLGDSEYGRAEARQELIDKMLIETNKLNNKNTDVTEYGDGYEQAIEDIINKLKQ